MEILNMNIKKYNSLLKKIDTKLKKGGFFVKIKEYTETNNVFSGRKITESFKKVKIINRKDQFLIDNQGCFHSILKDFIKL